MSKEPGALHGGFPAAVAMLFTNLFEAVKSASNVARLERSVAGLYLDVAMKACARDFDVFVVFDDDAGSIGSANGQETGDTVKVLVEKATMDGGDPCSLFGIKGRTRGEFLELTRLLVVVVDIQRIGFHPAMSCCSVGSGKRGV